jgi:hydrogenase maturation protease
MRLEQVKEIANAVLYEGYLLYPYRHSAIKNRQRWTFGVVYPREYSEANGGIEPWMMQTECLITEQENKEAAVDVCVRFLHLLVRKEVSDKDQAKLENVSTSGLAEYQIPDAWEEGVEREVCVQNISLRELVAHPRLVEIAFPGRRLVEQDIRQNEVHGLAAEIVREQQPITGAIVLTAEHIETKLFKLRIQIENRTPETGTVAGLHHTILLHSFVSTHTILEAQQGAFISLLDPPEELRAAAQGCQNLHTWPVLVGDEGESHAVLSSPIILYDYPQIAEESPGPLFDGTEIDEILTLRIMTLSDEEKQEIRQGDEHARTILERTENLSPEQFMKLHGTIRSLRAVDETGAARRER